ncbi:MAG TPA: hypothetical protein P5346_10625 [Spirochaetota bacterium]|nr:hypothetical protein [Spirochaetota bacterium]HSA15182.1 hypothetical protein [Spirochaetota bacterium]
MATATLNPVINSISGGVGHLVFYERYGKTIMRAFIIPPNPRTPAQQANRSRFRDAMGSWRQLPDEEKDSFNRTARRLGMTGHNLYISRYMKRNRDNDADSCRSDAKRIHEDGDIQTCRPVHSCPSFSPGEKEAGRMRAFPLHPACTAPSPLRLRRRKTGIQPRARVVTRPNA